MKLPTLEAAAHRSLHLLALLGGVAVCGRWARQRAAWGYARQSCGRATAAPQLVPCMSVHAARRTADWLPALPRGGRAARKAPPPRALPCPAPAACCCERWTPRRGGGYASGARRSSIWLPPCWRPHPGRARRVASSEPRAGGLGWCQVSPLGLAVASCIKSLATLPTALRAAGHAAAVLRDACRHRGAGAGGGGRHQAQRPAVCRDGGRAGSWLGALPWMGRLAVLPLLGRWPASSPRFGV